MGRNQEQNASMRTERKEKILVEALKQFSTYGLAATKIKDIATAAGMSQGLMYHYYNSKEKIYVELIENALDKLNSAVFSLQAMPLPPHEKISLAINEMLKTIASSDAFVQTSCLISQTTNLRAIPEETKKILETKRAIPYQELAKIMVAGQKAGTIIQADPEELALIFWTTINGLAIYRANHPASLVVKNTQLIINMFLEDENNGSKM
ncbi:MAG: TetR/AcrR family transcriptional regulator [Clostridia bacterium]